MQAVLERTTQCITAKNKAQWLQVQTGLENDLKTLKAVHDTSDGDTSKAIKGVIKAANLVQTATSRNVFK
jgi:DNA polymerase III delta prime subunit